MKKMWRGESVNNAHRFSDFRGNDPHFRISFWANCPTTLRPVYLPPSLPASHPIPSHHSQVSLSMWRYAKTDNAATGDKAPP